MAISNSTLDVDVWNEVRSTLVAASITVDSSTVPVRAQYNDKASEKPQIIIIPIDNSEDTFKFGSYDGRQLVNVNIECWAGNTADMDYIADEVKTTLKENPLSGMDIVGISTNYGFNTINDNKYHLKVITFTYMRE